MEISCKAMGDESCSFKAKGRTKEELLKKVMAHGKKVHGYTEEQMKSPQMMKQFNEALKH